MLRQPASHPSIRLGSYSMIAAVSVGSLYVTQSLLPLIAPDLGLTNATAGLLVSTVQLGYAAGLLVLVTRADDARMRRRSVTQLVVLCLAFTIASTQTTLIALVFAFLVIGFVSSVGQSVMTVAHAQSPPGRSTHRVAVVTAAMLAGMFGGRILAGVLAGATGWQGVLAVFAVLALLAVPLVLWSIPRTDASAARPARTRPVRATVALLLRDGRLRQLSAVQFFAFAGFTAMWTVIAMHLTHPSMGWSIVEANWFGLVGLGAGLVALLVTTGPLTRILLRGRPRRFGFGMLFVGAGVAAVQPASPALLGLAMFAVTLANQLIHAVNQDSVMTLVPEDRAKANAAFMVVVFLGGALGAAVGPMAYVAAGMRFTAVFAAVAGLLGALATARWWRPGADQGPAAPT